ncbi:hypothetical protein LIER_31324 [Lithospermum erythrorhizon]|uniref:Bulb-type lectin domain-containing protein n=1 Tax=Lithospermum erythrorhizon TaxID=34254 RepID=A0AAV3RU79_LITER
MKIYFLVFIIDIFVGYGYCKSSVEIGYQVTLGIPIAYSKDFVGRAFLINAEQMEPKFKVALSVEADEINEKYGCSIDVFLGEVKVWSSGHLSRFYTTEKCMLELTQNGDLQLKGIDQKVGWRSGTSSQDVKRLHLLRTGNLVLVDDMNLIKWQSFNFPTDIMLWGQRLSSETRLTSFPFNSTIFFSFEIQHNKIALYLNSGTFKYAYWEFTPPDKHNITYVQLTSKGLEVYNDLFKRTAQISSQNVEAVRFLALENSTGNFGLYYYSDDKGDFEASFQATNSTCDLPLACKAYGICTYSNSCSCIRTISREKGSLSDCSEEFPTSSLCVKNEVQMVELQDASSILRGASNDIKKNVSRDICANLCLMDECNCVAALYDSEEKECYLYGMVRGVKQVERGSKFRYMVKVPKGTGRSHGRSAGLKKWILVLVVVVDGVIILLVGGALGYYVYRRRKRITQGSSNDS